MARQQPSTILLTFAAGLAGAILFSAMKLPAAALSGAMTGVVALILSGRSVAMPDLLRDLGLILAGLVLGSAITPEMIRGMASYPLSLLILFFTVAGVTFASQIALVSLFKWPKDVALFASMPGAMSAVIATAAAMNTDISRVVVVQAFRLFVLVTILPSFTVLNGSVGRLPAPEVISIGGFAIVMVLSVAVALAFERFRVISPYLFGGMLAGALTHATGAIPGTLPTEMVDFSMFLIGIFAGSRIVGVTLRAIGAIFLPALVSFLVALAVTAIGAAVTVLALGIPVAEVLIAFAPGGLEAMVVLGLALGLDPLYLSSHHVARFVMIAALVPFIARATLGRS
jgi:membrane AbrB-like protein